MTHLQEQQMRGFRRLLGDIAHAARSDTKMGTENQSLRSTSSPDDGQANAGASIDARSAESATSAATPVAHPAHPLPYSVEASTPFDLLEAQRALAPKVSPEEGCAFLRMVAAANPTFSRRVALARAEVVS